MLEELSQGKLSAPERPLEEKVAEQPSEATPNSAQEVGKPGTVNDVPGLLQDGTFDLDNEDFDLDLDTQVRCWVSFCLEDRFWLHAGY